MDACEHTGHEDVDYVATDLFHHLAVCLKLCFRRIVCGKDELVVLCAHHNGVNTHGCVVVVIFYGHLTLGIGAQIGHLLSFATNFGQHLQQAVREVERKGHVVLCLIGGIAEHHTLVAGTLLFAVLTVHTTVDVTALFVNSREHTTGIALEHVLALGVADAVDHLAGNALQVHISLCLYFTSQHHLACGNKRLASHL